MFLILFEECLQSQASCHPFCIAALSHGQGILGFIFAILPGAMPCTTMPNTSLILLRIFGSVQSAIELEVAGP